MSLATGTNYRITYSSTAKTPLHSSNMLKQKLHHFCNRSSQSRAESTRDTYIYVQYINQFPPNTIKVIREFERIQKKICRHEMSIMFNEIYIYIYNGSKSDNIEKIDEQGNPTRRRI